ELVRHCELGLEVRIGAREAVAVAAASRRLRLENRTIRVWTRILADFRIRAAKLERHVLADRRERVRCDEASRHRRIEEGITWRCRPKRSRPARKGAAGC